MSQPKSYQGIMVSSTFTDLIDHRRQVKEAIEKLGYHFVGMESSGASDSDVIHTSLQMVRDSAAYIGILTHRYGQTPEDVALNPDSRSITELEFDEAMRLGRPILLFIMADDHKLTVADFEGEPAKRAKLDAFKVKAKRKYPHSKLERIWETFSSPEEFTLKAAVAIANLVVRDLSKPAASEVLPSGAQGGVHVKLDDANAKLDKTTAKLEGLQARLDLLMGQFDASPMARQARDGNVSESAVRAVMERALREGIAENDILPWLPEWIERARVVFNTTGNEDEAFHRAVTEADALFKARKLSEASGPIMKNLANVQARAAEAAQETLRVQRMHIEKAIEIDEVTLNIGGVVEKLFIWAEIEGKKTDDDVFDFVFEKTNAYYDMGEQALKTTPLLILRDVSKEIIARFSKTVEPWSIGATQNRLGVVLEWLAHRLAGRAALDTLAEALAAHDAALSLYPIKTFPTEWASTQNSRAIVLLALGHRLKGEQSLAALRQGRIAAEAALAIRTREVPHEWARSQNTLGGLLTRLAVELDGGDTLELLLKARLAFEAALGVWTREEVPDDWTMAQNNLGIVLKRLGERLDGEAAVEVLTQSKAAYEAVLTVRTREASQFFWAQTHENMANLAGVTFDKTGDRRYLTEGVTAARKALDVYKEMSADFYVQKILGLLRWFQLRGG